MLALRLAFALLILSGLAPAQRTAWRRYRPGRGGQNPARFEALDIGSTFNRKVAALQALETANQRYAVPVKQRLDLAGTPRPLLREINRESGRALLRASVEELGETIGKKHGFRCGEQFNFPGGGDPVPPHVGERAKPLR
jgi:hypothetical protein